MRCCRLPTARSSGSSITATRTATATSSTSARPTTACRTRGGRTPGTRCGSPTARWPRRRSRSARCRATCTRRWSRARTARPRPATTSAPRSLRARADELKRRFNEDFWVDTADGGYFALGPRPRQAPHRRRRLEHGPLPVDRHRRRGEGAARRACARVARRCSAGGASARCRRSPSGTTRSRTTAASVWPHDNALCAAGLMRYGFVDEAHQVMRGLVDASPLVRRPAPRAVRGHRPPRRLSFPVSYPTSCSPQAWAAASPLLFLRTLLRFEPDIRNDKLHLAPAVPDWIGTLRLDDIPIMGGQLGGRGDGRGREGARGPGGAHDRVGPALADDRADVGVRRASASRASEARSRRRGRSTSSTSCMPASASSRSTRSLRELRAHLGAHLLARRERHVERERAHVHRLRRASSAGASRSTRARVSKTATCSNGVDVEVGVELAVHHVQHVLVELGRDALRRRRTRLRAGRRPSRGRCRAGGSRRGRASRATSRRNVGARSGSRLPIVPPRNTTSRRPPRGIVSRSRVKSPTTGCTSIAGVLLSRSRPRRRAACAC